MRDDSDSPKRIVRESALQADPLPRMPDARPRDSIPAALGQVVEFFENLKPEDLGRIRAIYAPQASFKDPFNEVSGVVAIEAIFAAMFRQVRAPQFFIRQWVVEGDQAFLTWDFEFQLQRADRGKPLRIHGASRLVFDEQGRIVMHRDYWDAAEELYEKLPVVGVLMRWLKRRVGH